MNTEDSERIIRRPELSKMLGVSPMTIDRLERAGRFPRRLKLSRFAVGWLESEVAAWLEAKANARDLQINR